MKVRLSIIFIVLLLLTACNGDEESIESHSTEQEGPAGIELVAPGVSKEVQKTLEENFHYIETGHNQMIYRETKRTQELFSSDRPDLANGKLYYNMEDNHITYTFYYTPKASDISLDQDSKMMNIDIAKYIYMNNAISTFFQQVKLDLNDQGINLYTPTISYLFLDSEEQYLHIAFSPASDFQTHLTFKYEGDSNEYGVTASFATGV